MKPVVYNGHYIVNSEQMEFEQPVEIHFTRFGNTETPCKENKCILGFSSRETFKVFCNFNEPTTSENTETTENVILYRNHYDLILTSRDEIIETCDNAVFFPYGSTWLYKDINHPDGIGYYHPSIDKLHENKSDTVSFLITKHRGKEGYDLRHKVWNYKNEIPNNRFFSSTRNPVSLDCLLPNDDKKELFTSKFSVIIESTKEENYFTEKLCDALLSKTIPIYWGCPNIDDFFDTKGMIICNSAEEIVEACKNLDYSKYDSLKQHVDSNFEEAKKYCLPLTERIQSEIARNLKPKQKSECLLSVGVLTIDGREHFLNRIIDHFKHIIGSQGNKIEIIVSHDNRQKTVGEKRNEVLDKASGKYVCFVDDDDLVSNDYFEWIVQVLEEHPDADGLGFKGNYYSSGDHILEFSHSSSHKGHHKYFDKGVTIQQRPLNHLNPVRTEIAREIRFPEKNYGEDTDYCDRLLLSGLLKKEVYLDKILYHYFYDPKISATQNGDGVNV